MVVEPATAWSIAQARSPISMRSRRWVLYAGKLSANLRPKALAERVPWRRCRAAGAGDRRFARTDLKGAVAFGIDCLFVTAGIHAQELGGRETPDIAALDEIFAKAGAYPKAVMRRLVW
jgi:ribonucleotide monophosphatase NagD (HAD superfamily)